MNLKRFKKIGVLLAATVLGAVLLAGCGNDSSSADKKDLVFSKSQGPYSELFEQAVKPIMEKKGYKITARDMSDLFQADVALNDGEVDFNVEQHTAYMDNFNKKQNGHLVALTPIPTVPAGIYPGSKTQLSQVADGDSIAVPNDASNTARAYALLQKAGLIKLDPNKDLATVTKADIIENPHHLNFVEMKSLTIPSVRTALMKEDILPYLLLQLVVLDKNKDTQWAKDLKDAYNSPEFKEYMKTHNNGLWYVPENK